MSVGDLLTVMEGQSSPFEDAIRDLALVPCEAFSRGAVSFVDRGNALSVSDGIDSIFPKVSESTGHVVLKAGESLSSVSGKRIAVLFSGGPAAGGHNVVVGLKQALGDANTLLGVRSGPKGLMEGDLFEISSEDVAKIANTGGFDFLGSDRTKIKSNAQFDRVRDTVTSFNLDGIVVVGGDDSNTNAAFLAERLADLGCQVVGVPKTIDGDLQVGDLLPISFGFDTATKVYAELVGNILQDTPSSQKYWHFVKVMGRSASHVALEVALQTRPQITLISEEIAERRLTLDDIVTSMAQVIAYRAGKGLHFGVALIPEGVIEFIPECRVLIDELNRVMGLDKDRISELSFEQRCELVVPQLSSDSQRLIGSFPKVIQEKLLLDRDAHGNLQVSQIPTEVLLIEMVEKKLHEMRYNPAVFFGDGSLPLTQDEIAHFQSSKFATNQHFFGYEGRCGAPSLFDAQFTYNLGLCAGSLILDGRTGYMASVMEFDQGAHPVGIPLTGLIHSEQRDGGAVQVIEKALVKLDSPAFQYFASRRESWAELSAFTSPGPRQLWGPCSKQLPFSVALNRQWSGLEFKF